MKIENKLITSIIVIAILLIAFTITSFSATGLDPCDPEANAPAAKAAAVGYKTQIIPPVDSEKVLIANAYIKAHDELIISFSSEAILFTETKVSRVNKDATAASTLRIWAEVDGNPAYPEDGITFAERKQSLFTTWTGDYMNESYAGIDSIELALSTTNANSFNFIAYEIGKNEAHNVTIWASVETTPDEEGISEAWGAFGNRTLVIEEVNLKDMNLECTEW